MRGLEDKINHYDSAIKEQARATAKQLVQQFMVRRTRNELKAIASAEQDEYLVEEGWQNYPKYESEEYQLDSNKKTPSSEIKGLFQK